MNKRINLGFISVLIFGIILLTSSCKKDDDIVYGSVNDIEGNTYKTVVIGTQTWMAENLKTAKFNDNNPIQYVIDTDILVTLITPAYCLYPDDPDSYKSTYGALYNGYTILSGKLCPTDWHVPTDTEWTVLTNYLGGLDIAGDKLKEKGTLHWESMYDVNASNESGFTALGSGGYCYLMTWDVWEFYPFMQSCFLWSSTKNNTDIWGRFLFYGDNKVLRIKLTESYGCSVRCIKD
jgi:uncharacterized protein (TIGR02145 family)